MKKCISILLVMVMLMVSFVLPTFASTIDPSVNSGTMEITTSRTADVQVLIPADTSVPFGTVGAYAVGEIKASKMVIAPNKKVVITVTSQNGSKFVGADAQIPYVLGGTDAVEFKTLHDTTVYPLTVTVAKATWDKTPAGAYSDTLTFTLSYVNQ